MPDARSAHDLHPDEIAEAVEQIRAMARTGHSDVVIGERLGLRTYTVSNLRRKAGIRAGERRWLAGGRRNPESEPLTINLERARLMEAIALGRVRTAGNGVVRRMSGSNLRVDSATRQLVDAGWATVDGSGVYALTDGGMLALAAYQSERDARHGVMVERCAPRARPVGR